MSLKTHGTMAVDWEERIDFDRLRRERLERAKGLLARSSMGSLLCFDMNNVRYLTATHIGSWAQDKANRFTLLPQNDEPLLWDFGSAAKHHQLHCPWLGERSRPGISMLRGAMTPGMPEAPSGAGVSTRARRCPSVAAARSMVVPPASTVWKKMPLR